MYLFYLHSQLRYLPNRNWLAVVNQDKSTVLRVVFNYHQDTVIVYHNSQKIGETTHHFPTQPETTVFVRVKPEADQLTVWINRTEIVLHGLVLSAQFFYRSHWLDVTAFVESEHIPLTVTVCDSLSDPRHLLPTDDQFSIESDESDTESDQLTVCTNHDSDSTSSEDHLIKHHPPTPVIIPPDPEAQAATLQLSNQKPKTPTFDHDSMTLPPKITQEPHYLGPVGDYLSREQLNRPIQLSFCQTCLRRYSQITKTLPINLQDNLAVSDRIEFVVVDFGTPGLYEFIYQNFQPYLRTGYLRYLRTDQLPAWHASVAKNTTHRVSRGKILVNLDGDNYTGYRGAEHILRIFQKYGPDTMFHQWSGVSKDGTYGRISMSRANFFRLGGYDESFLPMGYQDHDIIMRYHGLGRGKYLTYDTLSGPQRQRYRGRFSRAIPNDKTKSLVNTSFTGRMDWTTMNRLNQQRSHQNIMRGRLQVNTNCEYLGVYLTTNETRK